ncbi:MAG: S9 family peptidase [Thermoflexibacter sp.]|jgi:dipeptidyl aminopeptidase/acylaminoacyl peptidase|nr:S9 family peptidase [Thermoflexibacter sp.]
MKEINKTASGIKQKQHLCILAILSILTLACTPNALDKGSFTKNKQYAVEDFYNTPYLKKPTFSANGEKILISTNKNGIFNVYALLLKDGKLSAMTDYATNAAYGISYFPEDERILYSLELSLDVSHIFVRNLDGTSIDVTPDSTSRSIFMRWSEDKKSFYYLCNKRDNRYFDIYKLDIANLNKKDLNPTLLFENKDGYEIEGMSKDENYLVLGKMYTKNHSEIYLHNKKSNATQKIIGDSVASANWAVGTTDNEKKLYFLTNHDNEFYYLKSYDFESGQQEIITKENWDITDVFFSPKNTYRALLINEDAQTKLKIYKNTDNEQIKIPNLPCGDISMVNFSKDEKYVCFILNTPTSPNDLYLYNFENQELKKINSLINSVLDHRDLSEPEFVKFPSFDGLEIPALLYKPLHLKTGQKVPAVVWVHSSLSGQSRATYTPSIQYLVNQGYVVLAVNNRGSYGYGKTFAEADDGKVGEVDLKDYIAGKKYLEKMDFIAEGKIGIVGAGTYGGYITLAALAFEPTEFAVGVDLFGITNWYKMLKNMPASAQVIKPLLYKKLGNPQTDSAELHKKSPLFFANQITRPLMIVQGANNPRVPKSETDQIINELKINQIPHEYLIFPDEAYFFAKRENEIEACRAKVKFLNKYLKGDTKTKPLQ